jgi:hypothetical protein
METIPRDFSLEVSHPTQHIPVVTAKYELPISTKMSLRVYDALGRDVFTIVDGFTQAGSHEITVNSAHLASGLYYFRMEAGTFIRTCKTILPGSSECGDQCE